MSLCLLRHQPINMIVKNLKLKVKSCSPKLEVFRLINFGLLIATLSFALCTLNSRQAQAQSLSLSLWPPLLEVIMQPGKTITQVYKLTNNSDHELSITPQIFPFEPLEETGGIKIDFSPPPVIPTLPHFSFASREKFDQAFPLPVGKTQELVLKINLPPNNPEKDYYYTLLFSTGEEPLSLNKDEGQSTALARIGTNILLTSSLLGKPTFLGRIVLFSAPFIVDSFSATNFTVILENWGKTFWKPFGEIIIEGPFDQKNEIALREQNILANSSRRLTLDSYRPRWPIGPFKAKLEFALNEDGQKLSSQITFWYLPYKLLAGTILLVILTSFIRLLKHRLSPTA